LIWAAFPPSVPKLNEVVRRSQSFLPKLYQPQKRISTQVGLQMQRKDKRALKFYSLLSVSAFENLKNNFNKIKKKIFVHFALKILNLSLNNRNQLSLINHHL